MLNTNFEKEELEGHRTLYIGVHVPLGRRSHRRHRHHGHRHRKRSRERDSGTEDGRESPSYTDTPSQRVQFLLGMEDDEEHIPHALFTELDEICLKEGEDAEWKETARWLKFEEDVEDGGERWSKPYVATLSLHSLFELRSCILNGTVMLDMRANSLEEIADLVLDQHETSVSLGEEVRKKIRNALLKQHHHQNQKKLANRIPIVRSFADIGRKQSEPHSMDKNGTAPHAPANAFFCFCHASVLSSFLMVCQMVSPQAQPTTTEGRADGSRENSAVDFSKIDLHFMKKIPPGAEASNILVGELEFLEKPVVAFIRLSPAVLLNGLAEVPITTRFLFILLGPMGKGPQYHEIGRSIATLMTDEEKRKVPLANGGADLGEAEEHGGHGGPELQRTGKFFGGFILDIKRKAPHYLSDYTDAISLQCLASFLFLYCACMSPVITFGGLLGEATEGRISAIESLFGASMTGIAYSLLAGQPLTILGSTGPVLVFEKILFKFCKEYGLSYLSLRVCIGLWTAFFCLLLVATDASSLVCYITRFTEEAFASLICIIFIYEALEKLIYLGETYPFNMHNDLNQLTQYSCVCTEPKEPSNATLNYWQEKNITASDIDWLGLDVKVSNRGEFVGRACGHHGPYIPDVLFWSVILFFSTVAMSSFLKEFKTSRYFPTKVRAIISDFAVFITILTMVLIDYGLGIPSTKLQVPNEFKPTRDDRGWFISPLGPNPWWTTIVTFIPALLCTILIFMDQQITAVIINRKEHKLKKGCGYHLDLFVVGVMLGVCSLMGLPWFVAATVLSISHVNSLKLESECSAPGEQPKFLGIREQRFTGLMIFVLMGSSVFMTSILKHIPMPVLYGVFLYMGASSLRGIQVLQLLNSYIYVYFTHSFFNSLDLSWLDDLMPESKKKKMEDAQQEVPPPPSHTAIGRGLQQCYWPKSNDQSLQTMFSKDRSPTCVLFSLSGESVCLDGG
uniref:Anion exchange protein n=1 Tax=Cyprinus carpio TaxID=7962 RepID=A0A8C1M4C0_CYPCA